MDTDSHGQPGGSHILGSGSTSQQTQPPPSDPAPSTTGKATPRKKFATLGDLGSSKNDDHDDSGDSDHGPDQDLFAGGEKSGLAVQNPDDIKRKIIEKARK
jgi:UBX domain-containing protein 1